MKFTLQVAGMHRRRALNFRHKKTAHDCTRRQLEKLILENTLLVNGTRKGGK
ncbi:hypothetical protein LABALGNA3A7_05530 [Dellaglioa algida]|nr:hypothetical protein LABALGNA3A7_05530 [Dellaglioa algida]